MLTSLVSSWQSKVFDQLEQLYIPLFLRSHPSPHHITPHNYIPLQAGLYSEQLLTLPLLAGVGPQGCGSAQLLHKHLAASLQARCGDIEPAGGGN